MYHVSWGTRLLGRVRFYQFIFFVIGTGKGDLPDSPKLSCKVKTELSNVTFIEGINSGNFTDMGHVSNFDQCKQKCCENGRCNIAFKIQDDCYGVACYSRQSCRTRPAKNANVFTPEMALMRSVQESFEQSMFIFSFVFLFSYNFGTKKSESVSPIDVYVNILFHSKRDFMSSI